MSARPTAALLHASPWPGRRWPAWWPPRLLGRVPDLPLGQHLEGVVVERPPVGEEEAHPFSGYHVATSTDHQPLRPQGAGCPDCQRPRPGRPGPYPVAAVQAPADGVDPGWENEFIPHWLRTLRSSVPPQTDGRIRDLGYEDRLSKIALRCRP